MPVDSREVARVRAELAAAETDPGAVYAALVERLGVPGAGSVWLAVFAAYDAAES